MNHRYPLESMSTCNPILKAGLLLLTVFVVSLSAPVLADVGPKPGMGFEFKHDGVDASVTVTGGTLYDDGEPLEEMGPQGFSCHEGRCRALAYGFGSSQYLELQFSDGKTRKSPEIERVGFDSEYVVTVHPDALTVEPAPSTLAWYWIPRAVLALFGLLILAVAVIALKQRRDK